MVIRMQERLSRVGSEKPLVKTSASEGSGAILFVDAWTFTVTDPVVVN
jgi:hypothetical protein